MKRIMKKFLLVILIFLILNNFLIGTCRAESPQSFGVTTVDVLIDFVTGCVGTLVAILTIPLRLVAILAGYAINALTANIAYVDGATSDSVNTHFITPFDIFFNKVKLFDINFFDITNDGSIISQIRSSVAGWYYVMRTLATAILLVILIYVGIRMAISTVASDRAMYKKMLIDWTASLAIIFVLQYIMIFTISANDAIVNSISLVVSSEEIANVFSAIAGMAVPTSLSLKALKTLISLDSLAATVIFCMLVWQTLGLVFSYFNRMLKIAFLIIISPLITLTYSIDKMGDGKAQSLDAWLKEFVFTILIQPFHCVIYMCFIDAAFDILVKKSGLGGVTDGGGALAASIIAILCVKFTKEGEKIVRKIFAFKDDNSGTSLAGGMAAASIALSQAKNIGKTARNTVNTAKAFKENISELRRNAKIDHIAAKAYLASKDGDKDYSYYREEASIKVNNEEAEKALSKTASEYKLENSEFKKQLKEEIAKAKDLNPGISDKEAKAIARRKVAQRQYKKNGTRRGRVISRASGKVKSIKTQASNTAIGKTLSKISNSETAKLAKDYGKASMNVGIGLMLGSGVYGTGGNVASAITSGIAMSSGLKEFMSGSKNTLSKGIVQNLSAIGVKDSKTARNIMKEIQAEADKYSGGDKTDEEVKKLIDEIMKAVPSNGTNTHSDIKNNIKNALNNPLTAPDAIKSILSSTGIKADEGAGKKLLDYSNKKAIYNQMQNAEASGITQSQLLESVGDRFAGSNEYIETDMPNADDDISAIMSDEHDISEGYDMSSYTVREEIDEYDGVISDLTKKREALEGKENITEDEKKTLEEIKKDIEDFTQDRDELIKEEARLREEFDRFTDEIDEEISRQYEELTELTPNTDGYQEVVSKIEKLKVEQAAIIARKLTRDKSYLESQGNNMARRYQRKLDEAIEILQQSVERTKGTRDYAKYQPRLQELEEMNVKLLEKIN